MFAISLPIAWLPELTLPSNPMITPSSAKGAAMAMPS
jgi:hypothetical protein